MFDTLDDCARAMRRLQGDAVLRRALGDRGRATAAEKWTPQAHLARYLEIIEELIPA